MAKLPPIVLPTGSIPQVEHEKEEDEFEDSLNLSISEQISEEIESHSAEDSIEKPKERLDLERKRRLFNLGDNDTDPALSRFDDNLDLLLSAENIAQHFKLDETNENDGGDGRDVNDVVTDASEPLRSENVASNESRCDEKSASGERSVGEANASEKSSSTKSQTISKSHHSNDQGNDEENDVILINDREISIHSLKRQQTENSADPSGAAQNTFSDVSDLLAEEVQSQSKEGKPSSERIPVSSGEHTEASQGTSGEQVLTNGDSDKVEAVSAGEETSEEKEKEMKGIVNEAVGNLPIEQKPRPHRIDSFATSDSERPASSGITEVNKSLLQGLAIDREFQDELNVNLVHMQNKIAELQNIAAGKYTLPSGLHLNLDTQSLPAREDPPSGREPTSILTNSTEYRTFQEEYLRVSHVLLLCSEIK